MSVVSDVVLAPWRAGRLAVRAADDLHLLAQRVGSAPRALEDLLLRADALQASLHEATARMTGLEVLGVALEVRAAEIVQGGADLLAAMGRLEDRSAELLDAGDDMAALARELNGTLRVFRTALPRMLEGLETVEHLEEAVESVTETVEPLAEAAEGVGRLTKRLSRRSRAAQSRPRSLPR